MCKVGDIIVVNEYIGVDGSKNSRHSFVVVDETANEISGLSYDFIANVMCSFKSEEHKKRKLSFKSNKEITSADIISKRKNNKSGYIRADELHYFDKTKINYYVFARIDENLLTELVKLIVELKVEKKLKRNSNNLQKEKQIA